ncbi:hypothetical protein SAMN05518672_105316 [Chitinophaga sp. CF118]|nr:hypothetical protein SAMN05518672_105316 [Chitinophaga sp. CF118]
MNDQTFLLEKDLISKHFFWVLSKKTYFCLAFIKKVTFYSPVTVPSLYVNAPTENHEVHHE